MSCGRLWRTSDEVDQWIGGSVCRRSLSGRAITPNRATETPTHRLETPPAPPRKGGTVNHRHLLPDEIDQLLDDETGFGMAPLQAHLSECDACRGRYEDARAVTELIDK